MHFRDTNHPLISTQENIALGTLVFAACRCICSSPRALIEHALRLCLEEPGDNPCYYV
ncbi:hypothetical protein BDV40DRAFT_277417 [Aspergillus tamarii]|uniref:Uncharacterized protein n=1 Tax=Aspergillus tamarii TaxID=41984 RepID=A0A5N6UGL8_ASPTM|nr:hypothetical protein BDV40DRAFT_277417 [Aspergillus tamarii]